MKYFLFVNFNTGLMHNAVYKTLKDVWESVEQLIVDEGLRIENETLPNVCALKKYLNESDDFCGQLSNGTWYHIHPKNIFKTIK